MIGYEWKNKNHVTLELFKERIPWAVTLELFKQHIILAVTLMLLKQHYYCFTVELESVKQHIL